MMIIVIRGGDIDKITHRAGEEKAFENLVLEVHLEL